MKPSATQPSPVVGLRGVAGILPETAWDLDELMRRGLIRSPQTLAEFGFERAYVASSQQDVATLALRATQAALADAQLEPGQIDLLVWASALPQNHVLQGDGDSLLASFRYSAGWLQQEAGLSNAQMMAVTQQGCATMFSALRAARALIVAEPQIRHVLCVSVDVLPAGATRQIMYNLISDAACAVVVSRDCPHNRWLAHHQISHGYYWDPQAKEAEIIAAYFPTSRAVIEELLQSCKLSAADIDVVIPTGVNRNSWEILLRLTGIPQQRLYRGAESFGHTISADNFLLLEQLCRNKDGPRGALVLLFTYGFGSTWAAILLER